jgi:hypothetical protein
VPIGARVADPLYRLPHWAATCSGRHPEVWDGVWESTLKETNQYVDPGVSRRPGLHLIARSVVRNPPVCLVPKWAWPLCSQGARDGRIVMRQLLVAMPSREFVTGNGRLAMAGSRASFAAGCSRHFPSGLVLRGWTTPPPSPPAGSFDVPGRAALGATAI